MMHGYTTHEPIAKGCIWRSFVFLYIADLKYLRHIDEKEVYRFGIFVRPEIVKSFLHYYHLSFLINLLPFTVGANFPRHTHSTLGSGQQNFIFGCAQPAGARASLTLLSFNSLR